MEYSIKHDKEKERFYTEIQGKISELQYAKIDESTLDFRRTFVPEALRGQGIAGEIVKYALEFAKKYNYSVIPSCSYVRAYIERHPEYKDVIG